MRTALAALLCVMPAAAHMVSVSDGELRIQGNQAHYQMRMPLYELVHVKDPEKTLLASVEFRSGGVPAKVLNSGCRSDAGQNAEICDVDLEFAEPVKSVEVSSRLPQVTVANHVHLLRATREGKTDQAVLDYSFPKATLRFEPPTFGEIALRETGAGAWRAAAGPVQLLFLVALVAAARSRRELMQFAAMFVAGEIASCLLLPVTGWQPNARFVEAAAALSVAYLSFESLLLSGAGQRWMVVGVLGVIHGFYFSLLIQDTGNHAGWILLGMALAEVLLIGAMAWVMGAIARPLARWQPQRAAAAVLLVTGLGWFGYQLFAY